jgi:hypothetical protein
VLFFPDDFKDRDGRWLSHLPADFVPILYGMEDGSWVCADCLNAMRDLILRGIISCVAVEDPSWRLTKYELHYDGPPVICVHCDAVIESMFGEKAP